MSDEKPVILRKRLKCAEISQLVCIVHYNDRDIKEEVKSMTDDNFKTIQTAVFIRQCQDNVALRLDCISANVPSVFDASIHGRHKWCFNNFTNVSRLRRLMEIQEEDESISQEASATAAGSMSLATRVSARSKIPAASTSVLFPETCIFCGKGRRHTANDSYDKFSKCVVAEAEAAIKQAAKLRNDFALLGKIDGVDLRAREARYHERCRRAYIQIPTVSKTLPDDDTDQDEDRPKDVCDYTEAFSKRDKQSAAYDAALENICEHISANIISPCIICLLCLFIVLTLQMGSCLLV